MNPKLPGASVPRASRGWASRSPIVPALALVCASVLFPSASHAAVVLKPKAAAGASAWPGGTFPDTSFEGVRYVS